MATLTLNQELNGIEVNFDTKPLAEVLEALKGAGFRWHRAKKLWYAKNTDERMQLAKSIAENTEIIPAVSPASGKSQKELKEIYMNIIKTEVWKDSEHMQKFAEKEVAYIVELSNGNIIDFDKPRIETSFCFGAGYNGFCTSEDWDNANSLVDRTYGDQEYFKSKNLSDLNNRIKELKSCLTGNSECYTYTHYTGQPEKSKLKTYSVCNFRYTPKNNPAFWSNLKDVQKLENDDIQKIIDGLQEVKKQFEKRLNTYLKRYGLTKIRAWSYISD